MKQEEPYVDEWIMYHKFLGFDHIHIMDNSESMSNKMSSLPALYKDLVTVEHYTGIEAQEKSYTSCVHRYNQPGNWIAFIDCDEFVVLRNHTTINDFIRYMAPRGDAVSLHRVIFGSNHHIFHQNLPVLARFIRRSAGIDKMVKTIAHAPDIKTVKVHYTVMKTNKHRINVHGTDYDKSGSGTRRDLTEDVAAVYHYRLKSEEEYLRRKKHGSAIFHEEGQQLALNKTLVLDLFHSLDREANEVVDKRAWDFFKALFNRS